MKMYDKTNNELAAAPTWTDCVTAINITASTGIFADTPESTMPTGWYIWRQWDSAAPVSTDSVVKSKLIFWDQHKRLITAVSDI
jgi:hypothetical protein